MSQNPAIWIPPEIKKRPVKEILLLPLPDRQRLLNEIHSDNLRRAHIIEVEKKLLQSGWMYRGQGVYEPPGPLPSAYYSFEEGHYIFHGKSPKALSERYKKGLPGMI